MIHAFLSSRSSRTENYLVDIVSMQILIMSIVRFKQMFSHVSMLLFLCVIIIKKVGKVNPWDTILEE
ncbi:hypothetical protein J2W91_005492 [Paenibacillus amylolyticus]|uniref:Uncharacterized protein n=1 Tax=Paenibacillus amylolyticus TaxID=1451 RepID=A0AAP5LPL0_PAEAM|nr:hypothetical protein [Paenibacillus amylolyticus]